MRQIVIAALLLLPAAALAQTGAPSGPTTTLDGRPTTPAPVPGPTPPPVPAIPPSSSQNRGLAAPAERAEPAGRPDVHTGAGPANATPYSGAPSRESDPQALPK